MADPHLTVLANPAAALHDAYAHEYDSQVSAAGAYITEALFGLLYEHIQPGQRILDLGIGTGLSARLFAKAGLHVYGMDFSPEMLTVCRAKGFMLELKQHDLQQTPWPYPSAMFDHLVCCGVLHFIPELDTFFSESTRLLRVGGMLAFTTKAPLAEIQPKQKFASYKADQMDIFLHAPDYLQALFEQNHFTPVKTLRGFVGQDIFYLWCIQKQT